MIVRNPLDSFYSQLQWTQTFNHSAILKTQIHEEFPEFWDDFVRDKIWFKEQWFRYLEEHVVTEIPVHFLRFEDLVSNPKETLTDLFKFMLGVESLEGTVAEDRINAIAAKGNEGNQVYKLKKDSKKMNKHVHRYTPAHLKKLKEDMRHYLYFFGYCNHPDREDTDTAFLHYSDEDGDVPHDLEKLEASFEGFRA